MDVNTGSKSFPLRDVFGDGRCFVIEIFILTMVISFQNFLFTDLFKNKTWVFKCLSDLPLPKS